MRRISGPIGLVSCLCFLTLQWSGLHVHAGEAGYIGGPETPYTHSHVHGHHDTTGHSGDASDYAAPSGSDPDNDYGDARDVSLLDQTLVAFKLPLAVLALVFLFTIFPLFRTLAGTEIVYRVLSGRYTRWRPPLRAPPRSAYS